MNIFILATIAGVLFIGLLTYLLHLYRLRRELQGGAGVCLLAGLTIFSCTYFYAGYALLNSYEWQQLLESQGNNYAKLLIAVSVQLVGIALFAFGVLRWTSRTTSRRTAQKVAARLQVIEEAEHDRIDAQNEFIWTLNHELRTSLNSVNGCQEVLGKAELTRDEREHFEALYQATNSIESLLDSIISYSSFTSGCFSLSPVRFTLRARAEQTGAQINKKLTNTQCKVRLAIDESIPERIFADPVHISRVWTNLALVGNALNPDCSDIRMYLNLDVGTKEYTTLHTNFCFLGSQPSKELIEQVRTITQCKLKEADLCTHPDTYSEWQTQLQYAARLARTLGGGISIVEEKDSLGFTLAFHTKCKRIESLKTRDSQILEVSTALDTKWLFDSRILIVEDEGVNRKLATKLFQRWGAQVDAVETGKEALERHLNQSYDLILLDFELPDMSGIQVAKLMRSYERTNALCTPIVCCSAHVLGEIQDECLAVGMNDFITKPIDQERLYEVVKALLTQTALPRKEAQWGSELAN